MLSLCPQRRLFDQGMLRSGLIICQARRTLSFRNYIAGGIHADLFQTVFSGVIPSIGLCIELSFIQLQLKRMSLPLGPSTTSGVQLRVSAQPELTIRGPLMNAIELKWYRDYVFVPPDVYAKRSLS